MVLIGGINVLESAELAMESAAEFVRVCDQLSLPYAVSYTHLRAHET